jgi:hypothetical protein
MRSASPPVLELLRLLIIFILSDQIRTSRHIWDVTISSRRRYISHFRWNPSFFWRVNWMEEDKQPAQGSSDCPQLSELSHVINCFHYISNVQESISAKTPPIRRLYTTLVHQTSREQRHLENHYCIVLLGLPVVVHQWKMEYFFVILWEWTCKMFHVNVNDITLMYLAM